MAPPAAARDALAILPITARSTPAVANVYDQIGLVITGSTFDRVVAHLVARLTSLGVPAHLLEAIGLRPSPLKVQLVTA
jgi:hypothetical protein